MNRYLGAEAEVVTAFGTGGIRGQPGTIGGLGSTGGNGTERTLGTAEHGNKRLKLLRGLVLTSGGSHQIVFAWECTFSGED